MRRAMVIPKAIAAVICLILAIVISIPVIPMMSSRMFGGGTLDFITEGYSEYQNNRPVSGSVYCILAASGGGESGGGLSKGSYYYLVPVKGKAINNKNKVDMLVLVKAEDGSDVYDGLNDLYRKAKGIDAEYGFQISGMLKTSTEAEQEIAASMRSKTSFKDLNISEYTLDLTRSISSMTIRFIISILFYILTVFCISITIQAINRNEQYETIQVEREAYRLSQEAKSGNKNEDGSDKMFGDSDASFGVTPRRDDDSDGMLGEGTLGGSGGYKPSFQSQGGEQPVSRSDDPFAGSMLSDPNDEDGFFGGGSQNNGGFFGGSQQTNSYGTSQQQNDYYGTSSQNYGGYGGQDDEDGFFGGGSQDNGGFFGGR